jgi:hypothetical protein
LLSGDTHHYSRYYASRTNTHFITSGGGGAFLHPTHHLKDSIEIRWLGERTSLSLLTDPDGAHGPTSTPYFYPPRKESKRLLSGNLLFWKTNPGFALLLGAVYWIFSMALVARQHPDAYVITFGILAAGMIGYFGYQEGFRRTKVWVAAIVHAAAHFGALVALSWLFEWANINVLHIAGVWSWFFMLLMEVVPTGLLVGGFIFGVYLLITCRWLDMNHNDAFSAMRLDCYRHFLRLCIRGDELLIFPVGIDRVPRRGDWQVNTKWTGNNAAEPAYCPAHPISPRLIEKPIVVRI